MATIESRSRRNLGIDCLRAVSMFFVICAHILGQGGLLSAAADEPVKRYVLSFLQMLTGCAVNCYGITTGFLLCRKGFRLSRLVKLWLTTVFWSVAVSCAFFLFSPESRSFSEAVSMFLPILRGRYWFFTAYFVVMLLSPALNHLILTLPKRTFQLLLLTLLVIFGIIPVASLGYDVLRISGGNHFSWMCVLYLIGGYLKVHGISRPRNPCRYLIGYLCFGLFNLLFKIVVEDAETRLLGAPAHGDLLITNTSPLILGEAICLFLFFKEAGASWREKGFGGRLISFAAPGVYAVYMIHVHPLVFWGDLLMDAFRPWASWNLPAIVGAVFGTAAVVFSSCILLDFLRQQLFGLLKVNKAAEYLSDQAESAVRKFTK